MGAAVSSSHVGSAAPSSSREDSSPSAPAPAWGPSHGREFCTDFSHVSPSHGLQLSMTCPSVGPSHGCSPSGTGCSSTGLPTGSQLPSGIPLLRCGVPSTGCRWRSAPPWTSIDCRGTACLTMVFITSCKGRLSALASRAPPPPPSLSLGSAEWFLSHRLAPLSSLPFHHRFFSSPSSICYPRGAATVADGLGLG